MAWTDEMVEELKKLWKEGVTTGEIGKRLGVSKNSIVGKVHRLGLSGRPSPIKRKDDNKEVVEAKPTTKLAPEKAPEKKAKETKAVKAEKKEIKKEVVEEKYIVAAEEIEVYEEVIEVKTKTAQNGKIGVADLDNHTCRWPIGDPKDENFHFCGCKVKLGQTYCDEHAAIAYVKTNKR